MSPSTPSHGSERPKVWMQCPGCWSANLISAPTDDIYIECDCGEKMTVIDLRDGPDGALTCDRGSLENVTRMIRLPGEPERIRVGKETYVPSSQLDQVREERDELARKLEEAVTTLAEEGCDECQDRADKLQARVEELEGEPDVLLKRTLSLEGERDIAVARAERDAKTFQRAADRTEEIVGEQEGLIARLAGAVTELQGIVYGPPEPPLKELDRAIAAIARLVDRLATSPPDGEEPEDCERCKASGVELRQGCGEWISDPCPDCNATGKGARKWDSDSPRAA